MISDITVEIIESDNVKTALDYLLQKPDSCGTDGMYLSQLPDYLKFNQEILLTSIKDGNYEPGIAEEAEYLRKTGKKRKITKLTSLDRLVLRMIYQVLNNYISTSFSQNSYAYRENVGVNDAVEQIRKFISSGSKFVAEIDLKDFFTHINHNLLIQNLLSANIDAKTILLIQKFLKMKVRKRIIP